jgi:c-di-AMP phosphodiesterase-like protein
LTTAYQLTAPVLVLLVHTLVCAVSLVVQVSQTIERAMSERASMLAERLAKYGVSALDEAEPLVVAQVPETAQVVWANSQRESVRGQGLVL